MNDKGWNVIRLLEVFDQQNLNQKNELVCAPAKGKAPLNGGIHPIVQGWSRNNPKIGACTESIER